MLRQKDAGWSRSIAGLGLNVPKKLDKPVNMSFPADADPRKFQPKRLTEEIEQSPALRMVDNPNFKEKTIKTRKIAFLVADGFNDADVAGMKKALMKEGAMVMTVAPRQGVLTGANGESLNADASLLTAASVLFDAVYVPDGQESVAALQSEPAVADFLNEAYDHCKPIAGNGAGVELLVSAGLDESLAAPGLILSKNAKRDSLKEKFIQAITQHQQWDREAKF